MNVKDLVRGMDKRKVYRWGQSALGTFVLFGETGKTIYRTDDRFEMETVTKKLRGRGINIIGIREGK